MKNKKSILCSLLACSIFAPPIPAAFAQTTSPTVIELYGQNVCSYDLDAQEQIYEIVRTHDNVIFLNCRILGFPKDPGDLSEESALENQEALKKQVWEEKGVHLYFNKLCTQKESVYSVRENLAPGMIQPVIINGRWEANKRDILPAIKLGGTDNVAPITLIREDEVLHITLPEINARASDKAPLTLGLYAYAPSTGMKIGEPIEQDPASAQSPKDMIEIMLSDYKRLIPLDEETSPSPQKEEDGQPETLEQYEKRLAEAQKKQEKVFTTYFRPVAATEEITVSDPDKTQYDISLATIISETGLSPEQMGYIVVLQQNENHVGPILAAGEIIPPGEKMHPALPQSDPPQTP